MFRRLRGLPPLNKPPLQSTLTLPLSHSPSPAPPSPPVTQPRPLHFLLTPPAADNGPSVGAIAGYAAAALAGVAVISLFAIWFIRRKRRRRQDADLDAAPFNRQSWLRNSAMIHDDTHTATRQLPTPRRDPEMIDRSFNATPVANYAGMNQYPQNEFGYAPPAFLQMSPVQSLWPYATQPSYQPGAPHLLPSSPHPSFGPGGGPALPRCPFSPVYDPATPNPFEQQAGYTEVTRGGPPSPFNPYHQQQQFDDIQRQMTPSVPNGPPLPAPRKIHRSPLALHRQGSKLHLPFFLPSPLPQRRSTLTPSRASQPTPSFLPRPPPPSVKSSKCARRRTWDTRRPCSMVSPRDLRPRFLLPLRPLQSSLRLLSRRRLSSPLLAVRSHAPRRCMIPKTPTAVSKEPLATLSQRREKTPNDKTNNTVLHWKNHSLYLIGPFFLCVDNSLPSTSVPGSWVAEGECIRRRTLRPPITVCCSQLVHTIPSSPPFPFFAIAYSGYQPSSAG
jgi:hypothetical protein